LIVAASEQEADLYYATRFLAPDPFIFAEIDGRKILVMSDLEIDRAKSEARVDEVLSHSKLALAAKQAGGSAGIVGVLDQLFRERQVKQVRVPGTFPVALADALREKGYFLEPVKGLFFPERMVKRPEEVEAIQETIRRTEAALKAAIDVIAQAQVRGEELYLKEKPLTSELIRRLLHVTLMGSDCLASQTIVAGGVQACDPHCIGSGPLKAHWPIILDVFPVSTQSRYYADITRTVVRGKPSEKVKTMYRLVQEGQEIGFTMIKAGVDGKAVHEAIQKHFEQAGFPTEERNGRMVGFFHGTGHGLGLEIHEAPRVGGVSDILQSGHVVTVEPGLYYPEWGGIRIEDDVLVTETGCERLSTLPKQFELD